MPALELDPIEARVLGVLVEKERTTPDQYPLTLTALVAGCNQKSNRAPSMSLTEHAVRDTIDKLRVKGLVGGVRSSGARAERYRHGAATHWSLSDQELAVMAELMLRGAQQPGELRTRAARMAPIESLEQLGAILEGLRARGFVQRLDPLPGERSPRWDQIVAGERAGASDREVLDTLADSVAHALHFDTHHDVEHAASDGPTSAKKPSRENLESRIVALEAEVRRLASIVAELE
ncbi:MAG: YceH family protein [Planctomycetota bacterium]